MTAYDVSFSIGDGLRPGSIAGAIGLIWNRRADRYSEIRTAATSRTKKIEMSYIGG